MVEKTQPIIRPNYQAGYVEQRVAALSLQINLEKLKMHHLVEINHKINLIMDIVLVEEIPLEKIIPKFRS